MLLQSGLLEDALRPSQAIMLSQRLARIRRSEQSAPLQERDHLRAEYVEHLRQHWRHDVEAVRRAVSEPVLDQVSDLLRRASGSEMAARPGEIRQQLPQCWLLPSH